MSTSFRQETAKIYAFPLKARTAAHGRRDESKSAALGSQRVPQTVFGSCWYHEAAVAESDQSRKP